MVLAIATKGSSNMGKVNQLRQDKINEVLQFYKRKHSYIRAADMLRKLGLDVQEIVETLEAVDQSLHQEVKK